MQQPKDSLVQTEQQRESIRSILQSQRTFFASGATKNIEYRISHLKKLYTAIKNHKEAIYSALFEDLQKSNFESYETEIGLLLSEISLHLKKIKKWAKPKKIRGELKTFPASYRLYPEPLGLTLIIAPWNYPFLLSIEPLIAAISAGNTAIVKTSEYCPHSAKVIQDIISSTFDESYVAVIQGGYIQNQLLLHEKFDFIFFTGSSAVGKIIMENAARTLTPVCLELGGKSPCIVDKTANIARAAQRIIWGKCLNAGQTCVAPDYVLVEQSVKDALIKALYAELKKQYGEQILENEDFAKIINKKHFNRLLSLSPESVLNAESNKIEPTILDLGSITDDKALNHPSMREEIFGPLLPIISYSTLTEAIDFIRAKPVPLALYLFTTDKQVQDTVLLSVPFGGGCINDVVMHLSTSKLPFGGVGQSGMGSYHGKFGFDTFSHYKSVLIQSASKGLSLRFAPYKNKIKILEKFLK